MERFLDCRGLACPAPVLKTKEAIETGEVIKITVRVDNSAARDNVSRFLNRVGYETTSVQDGTDFVITGTKKQVSPTNLEPLSSELTCSTEPKQQLEKILIIIATNRLGKEATSPLERDNNFSLGEALMKNFIATLKELTGLWRIIFINSGVMLTVEESPVIDLLKDLEKSGISILVCGTCLNFYNLTHKKRVGETTNMLDIVTSMQVATKVITLT